jgi:predicted lipoprotein with Yx(FWY)xxD motif
MSSTSIVARRLPALLLGLTVACGKKASDTETAAAGDTTSAAAPAAAPAAAVAVAPGGPVTLTVAARPGEAVFLTDANGRAVYYIGSPDGKAVVNCTGECATAFDPVTGKAVVATGDTAVKVALIGEITRPDGTKQVTYGGKPLYYHRGDQAAGGTTGQGMKTGGGVASLIGPDGNRASRPGR